MPDIAKDFKYTGEARDFGGTRAHHYENQKWIIAVWANSSKKHMLLQGTLENMNDDRYDFTLDNSCFLTYARVLESNHDGLGRRYDENDKLVPKYVVKKIKEIAHAMLQGNTDWQMK